MIGIPYTWNNDCVSFDLYDKLCHVFIATKIIGAWVLKDNSVCDTDMFIRSGYIFLFNHAMRKEIIRKL